MVRFTMNPLRELLKIDGMESDCVPSKACAALTPMPLAAFSGIEFSVKPSAVPSSKLHLALAQLSVSPWHWR